MAKKAKIKTVPLVRECVLTKYGPTNYGFGHITDESKISPENSKHYFYSLNEGFGFIKQDLADFATHYNLPLGTKIKITIST